MIIFQLKQFGYYPFKYLKYLKKQKKTLHTCLMATTNKTKNQFRFKTDKKKMKDVLTRASGNAAKSGPQWRTRLELTDV